MIEKKRCKKLDNIKWILTILIVLYHVQYFGQSGTTEKTFYYIKNLGDCVVPAFALISGYLFWSNISNISDVREKMKRRVYTLLVPYLLWNFLNTIMLNVMNKGYRSVDIFDINIWTDIIQWNSSPHFWYIFMLMFWTLFAPILYLAYKDKRILALLFLSQVFYLVYKGEAIYHSRFIYILYTWGGYIGHNYPDLWEKLEQWSSNRKKIVSICAIVCYLLLGGVMVYVDIGMHIKVWIYAIRAILLVIGCFNVPELVIGKKTNFKFSFWVFAVHYWLDTYVSAFVRNYVDGIVYQFITWGAVLFLALVSGAILDKVWHKGFALMTGNR